MVTNMRIAVASTNGENVDLHFEKQNHYMFMNTMRKRINSTL